MKPDELRALAGKLRKLQAGEAYEAADYLRACAEAQPVRAVPLGHALSAVRHVGSANYPDRERAAIERLYSAEFDAYAHPAPAAPQAEPIADSDADYWLRNRQAILDAIERAGFVLMSNASGFWLHPRGATDAQAEPDDELVLGEPDILTPEDVRRAVPQAEPIDPHMIVAEDRFPDVPAERWKPCPQCGEDVDRECPICDGLGRVLATDGEQAEPKPTPASGDDLNVYKEMADNYRNDAQAEPKREPLTVRRILEIEDDASRQWRDNGRIVEYAVVLARMVESAHGIGGSNEHQ